MTKTSEEIAKTVRRINRKLDYKDGIYIEFSQIGIVDAVTLHERYGRGELTLWDSEDGGSFSVEGLLDSISEVRDNLSRVEDMLEENFVE